MNFQKGGYIRFSNSSLSIKDSSIASVFSNDQTSKASFVICELGCDLRFNSFFAKDVTYYNIFLLDLIDSHVIIIKNSQFFNVNTKSLGGIISAFYNNNILITNTTFYNISALQGSIIYIKKYNYFFMNDSVTMFSSAIEKLLYFGVEQNNTLYFESNSFHSNVANNIFQLENGNVTIKNCTFENLTNGPEQNIVLYVYLNILVNFSNNTVRNCFCNNIGRSLIYIEKGNSVNFSNSTFQHIYNCTKGVVLFISEENILVISNIAVDNIINLEQGTFYAINNNNLTFENINVTNVYSIDGGGVMFFDTENKIIMNKLSIFNITARSYGAFIQAFTNNNITTNLSTFSNVSSMIKGGFGYFASFTTFNLSHSTIYNSFSSIGGVFALIGDITIYLEYVNITLTKSLRYGGIIYEYTNNKVFIDNCIFIDSFSQNLAAGFYLDTGNNLTIGSSVFQNFSAQDSSAFICTIFQNNIFLDDIMLSNLTLNQSNDGIIARFGSETYVSFKNSYVRNLTNVYSCFLFVLERRNTLQMQYMNFSEIYLENDSGFLEASDINVLQFTDSFLKFHKSQKYGSLFHLITNNYIQNMRNITFNVENFQDIFLAEINGTIEMSNVTFLSMKKVDAIASISASSTFIMKSLSLILENQIIQGSASKIFFKNINILFNTSVFFSESFFLLSNCSLYLTKSAFNGYSGKTFNYKLIIADSFSTLKIKRSLIMGMKSATNGGLLKMEQSNQIYITKSSILYCNSKENGGIGYATLVSLFKSSNSSFFGNKAYLDGGAFYLSNVINSNNLNFELFMDRIKCRMHQSLSGGCLYVSNASVVSIMNSEFKKNYAVAGVQRQATAQNDLRAQGGALFLNAKAFINKNNSFIENIGEIGGALFLSPLSLVYSEIQSNFNGNKAFYYGDSISTPFFKLEIYVMQQYETINKNIIIKEVQSGYTYPNCLLLIAGLDKFYNTANNTNEDLFSAIKQLNQTPTISTYEKSIVNGMICLKKFTRTKVPIPAMTQFSIQYTKYREKSLNVYDQIKNQNLDPMKNTIDETSTQKQQLVAYLDFLNFTLVFRDCKIGEKLTQAYECQTCPDGRYSLAKDFSRIVDNCKQCIGLEFDCYSYDQIQNVDLFQGGGSDKKTALYAPKPGYWRYSGDSIRFMKCDKPERCLGGFLNSTKDQSYSYIFNITKADQTGLSLIGFCDQGYKGILCNECDESYGKINSTTCLRCQESGYILWILFQILLKLIIIFISLHISFNTSIGIYADEIKESNIKLTNLIKIILNHIQMLIILMTFVDFTQIYNDVVSFFLGINSNVSESFNLECLLKYWNWDLNPLYFQFFISILYIFPLLLLCIPYVYMMTVKWRKRFPNQEFEFAQLYLSCILIILGLCYFDIMNITIKMFPCFNVSDAFSVEERLRFDYSIRCESYTHYILEYAVALPVILIYGVVFPITIFLILFRKYNNNSLRSDNSLLVYGYFFFVYEKKFFFWDILQLLRKFVMMIIQILLASADYTERFATLQLLLVVVFIFLCLQLQLSPYLRPNFHIVNKAERTSLLALTLSYYFALFHNGLLMTGTNDFGWEIALFLLGLLFNLWFFVYWGYIFIPEKIKNVIKYIKVYFFNEKEEIKNHNDHDQNDLIIPEVKEGDHIKTNSIFETSIDSSREKTFGGSSRGLIGMPSVSSKMSLFGEDYPSKRESKLNHFYNNKKRNQYFFLFLFLNKIVCKLMINLRFIRHKAETSK